jgi:hypothetical protein
VASPPSDAESGVGQSGSSPVLLSVDEAADCTAHAIAQRIDLDSVRKPLGSTAARNAAVGCRVEPRQGCRTEQVPRLTLHAVGQSNLKKETEARRSHRDPRATVGALKTCRKKHTFRLGASRPNCSKGAGVDPLAQAHGRLNREGRLLRPAACSASSGRRRASSGPNGPSCARCAGPSCCRCQLTCPHWAHVDYSQRLYSNAAIGGGKKIRIPDQS